MNRNHWLRTIGVLATTVATIVATGGVANASTSGWDRFYRSPQGDRCGADLAETVWNPNNSQVRGGISVRARGDDCSVNKNVGVSHLGVTGHLIHGLSRSDGLGVGCGTVNWTFNSTSVAYMHGAPVNRSNNIPQCGNGQLLYTVAYGAIWKPAANAYAYAGRWNNSPNY
jgi:hypothetical protein